MKRLYILLLFILTTASLSAQGVFHKGFAFGADRDTLQYIIASPFDNWFLRVGGGLQTFIGNEVESDGRHNTLDWNANFELGKWIIPDLAVSLRYSLFSVHGKSKYGLQPFIDFTGVARDPVTSEPLEYQKFSEHAMSLLGFVTIDWTNFFRGYERGKRTKLHIYTPVGLGASMLFGKQKNPNNSQYDVGDFRRNFELAFCLGVGTEYIFSQRFSMNAGLELFGSESTWDWSPYDNSHSIFDFIPSLNISAKFNLLKFVNKYKPATHQVSREKVNHEFIAVNASNTVKTLNGQIEKLNHEKDSLLDLSDQLGDKTQEIAAVNKKIDDMEKLLQAAEAELATKKSPQNIFEELIDVNGVLNLPATIVYYELDKYNLDYNARKRLEDFAKEARQHDDTVQFYVIGAADSLTGSIRHNQWLSERRSEAALKMLIDNYGMNASQLIQISVGGITEYDEKEDNRMAMIILKTPITEEIVERWLRRSKENLKKR